MAKSKKIDFSSDMQNFTFADIMGVSAPPDAPASVPDFEAKKAEELDLSSAIRLSIRRRGCGGKTVTLVTGVKGSPAVLEAFVKSLKKGLGCGASLDEDGIAVQGDQRERLVTFLKARGAKNVK